MDDDETLLFKPEVFLYKMPPSIQKKEGYIHRAADWDIAQPTWYGKLTIFAAGPTCHVMLEDKKGKVFGQAVIEDYPGKVLDNVFDSSRYFVLKIQKKSGEFEKVGIGFSERKDSAELKSVLTNYFASIARAIKRPPPDDEEAKSPKKLKVAEVKPEPQKAVARRSVQFAESVKAEAVVKVERLSEERESSAGTSALVPKTAPVSAVSPQQRPSNTVPLVPASKLAAGKIVPKVPPPPPTISKPPVKYSASASKEGVTDFQPVVVKQERLSIVSPAVENPASAVKAPTAVKSSVVTKSEGPLLNVPATLKPKPKPTAVPAAPKISAVPAAPKISEVPAAPKVTTSSTVPKIAAGPIKPKISTSPLKAGPTEKKSSVAIIPSTSTPSKTATVAPISTSKQTQPKSILKKSADPILAAPTVATPSTVPTTLVVQPHKKSLVPYNEKPLLVPYDETFVESPPGDEQQSVDVSEEFKSASELESPAVNTTKLGIASETATNNDVDVIMSESSEAPAGNDGSMETSSTVASSEKPTEDLPESNKSENVALTSTPEEDTPSKTVEENGDSADGSCAIVGSEVDKKAESETELTKQDASSIKGETPEIGRDQQVENESERALKTEQSSLEFTELEDGMEGGGGESLMDTEEVADQIPPPDSILQEDIPSVLDAEADKALKEITHATEIEQPEDHGAEEDANNAEEEANEALEGANQEDFGKLQEEQAADEMEYAEGAVDEAEYAEGQGEEACDEAEGQEEGAFNEAEGQEEGAFDEAEGQEEGAFDEAEGQEEEAFDEAEGQEGAYDEAEGQEEGVYDEAEGQEEGAYDEAEGQEEEAFDETEYTEGQEDQAECDQGEEYATVEEYDEETGDIIGSIEGDIDEFSTRISNEFEETGENEEVSNSSEAEVTQIEATAVEPKTEKNDEEAEDSPSAAAPDDDDANTDTQDDGLQDGTEDEDNITLDQITTATSDYKYRNGSKFQCHKCPEACEDSQGIKTHWMHAHSYRNPLSCPVCKLPFPSKVEAAMHKKRAHGLFCADCSKVFKNDKEMQNHMRTKHAKNSQLSCKFCGNKFKGKRELVAHYDKDHWSVDFLQECGICKLKFLDDDDLKEHEMAAHVGQNSYACEQCPQTFRTRGALRTHQRQLHPGC